MAESAEDISRHLQQVLNTRITAAGLDESDVVGAQAVADQVVAEFHDRMKNPGFRFVVTVTGPGRILLDVLT